MSTSSPVADTSRFVSTTDFGLGAWLAAWRFWIAIEVLVGMSEMSSGPSGRSARSVYILIGAAVVVGIAVLDFGRNDPIRPTGVVPTQLQALIEKVVAPNGGRVLPNSCTMMGNVNLGVTCKVDGVRLAVLRDGLLRDGWQPTPGPPLAADDEHGVFVRGDEHLSVDGNRGGAVLLVSARKRKP